MCVMCAHTYTAPRTHQPHLYTYLQSVQGVGPFHGAYLRYSTKEYACSLICILFQRL